ncbi:helix-turn-helix domain-containing protein [Actinokineospora iranica]|uniref:Helix-turn-helix domain-containing protein n=1 Tax=Actinokineospora iranica TaxID=1271860 RepID=A0A1G6X4Y6_9PSEU|nr:helix-turn-helix transcriptional regulator [Actinokineospora iranica]SDD73212.1 Helix-turn-helix domain-containing protein [Actinokineospora iranica]
MRIDVSNYQRILGDEIRRLRKQRGWTRKELNGRLQSDISLQTLATYELGTRQCSVVRFVEICVALDALPHDLMARVHDRAFAGTSIGRVRVNLHRAVRDPRPELLPLRRWAAERLLEHDPQQGPADVHLDIAALEQLAALCGMETIDLISRLRELAGSELD